MTTESSPPEQRFLPTPPEEVREKINKEVGGPEWKVEGSRAAYAYGTLMQEYEFLWQHYTELRKRVLTNPEAVSAISHEIGKSYKD